MYLFGIYGSNGEYVLEDFRTSSSGFCGKSG